MESGRVHSLRHTLTLIPYCGGMMKGTTNIPRFRGQVMRKGKRWLRVMRRRPVWHQTKNLTRRTLILPTCHMETNIVERGRCVPGGLNFAEEIHMRGWPRILATLGSKSWTGWGHRGPTQRKRGRRRTYWRPLHPTKQRS